LTFITLLNITPSAWSSNLLKIGYIERAPHIYANADGSVRGLTGKKLVSLFRKANVDVDMVRTYQKDIANFIKTPSLDAFIATLTLIENPENFVFSAQPLFNLHFYLYHLNTEQKVQTLSDLKGVSISLPLPLEAFKGPLKEHIHDPKNSITVIADELSLSSQLLMLRNKKAQYAISYLGESNAAMTFSKGFKRRELNISELFILPMYLVIKRENPHADELMSKINLANN
jgi:hypothetical protein